MYVLCLIIIGDKNELKVLEEKCLAGEININNDTGGIVVPLSKKSHYYSFLIIDDKLKNNTEEPMIVPVGNITEQPIQQKQEKEPSKKRKIRKENM